MTEKTAEPLGAVAGQVERRVRPLLALTPKTRKARSRLREACADMPNWRGGWAVQQEQDSVVFAPGKRGPWLYVAPVGADSRNKQRHSRWVHEHDDADFCVSAA